MRAGASSSSRSTARSSAERAPLAELGGERAQALLAPGDEHERGAGLAREAARGGLADAARGACYQHDLAHDELACQIGKHDERKLPRKREALELFSGLPRRYDALSAALSFWQDPRWRRALVSALAPAPGERIVDVATGTGMVAAELLARADCSVVGVDQSAEMLAAARARFAALARREGRSRAWS